MRKSIVFLMLVLGIIIKLTAQTPKNLKIINSGDLIKKGIDLYENKKYDEAIDVFKSIPQNDTNYAISLYEYGMALAGSEKYSEAVDLAFSMLKNSYLINNKAQLYCLLGNCLDDAKRSSEAIEIYNKAIKEFPYNYQLCYNLALVYYKSDQLDKAEELLFKSLKLNVFHQSSHNLLGYINLKRGKLVPAILAFNMCVIISPGSKRGKAALETMENMFNGELNEEMEKEKFSFPEIYDNSCFDEIETLIKSNFALNKKYKVNSKITNIIIKQDQLVFENLKQYDTPKGIYNEFYLPFFKSVMEENYFEEFSYYLFSGLENEKIKSFIEKNKSKVKKFKDWGAAYVSKKRMYQLSIENEKKDKIKYFFNDNERLYSFGEMNNSKTPEKTGNWNYINQLGGIETFGVFEKNLKQGNWKSYYNNGQLNEDLQYKNDELDGFSTKNHENGEIKIKINLKKDKRDGEYAEYNFSGVISENASYKNGLIEGVYNEYFSQGQIYSQTEYKAGKKDGNFKRYFANGNIDMEVPYINGLANGKYIEYFLNGNIYAEGNYKDNFKTGYWKNYFFNKQLKNEGAYDEKGRKVGLWKSYYSNGVIEQQDNYSLNGKQNGESKYYNKYGDLLYTYTFKNELLTEITCYNKEKKEIGKFPEKRGIVEFKLFSADGKVTLLGKLKNGLKEGLWKKYDENGILIYEENYEKGEYEGNVKNYYKNGNISTYCEYKEDDKNGLYQSFYRDGTLKQEGYYGKDNMEGYWYTYYNNGNISEKKNYLNDKQNGFQEEFNYFGKKTIASFYENGFLISNEMIDTNGVIYSQDSLINGNGMIKRKNLNGTLALKALFLSGHWKDTVVSFNGKGIKTFEGFYLNGRRDGLQNWYFDNGVLKSSTFYKYGDEEGLSKDFNEKGELNIETKYQNGRTEKMIYYYPNGKPEIVFNYEDGERFGHAKYFTMDGQFAFQILYQNSIPVSYSYKEKDGKITDEKPINKENGKLIAYFQNGSKAADISFNNGERNGKMILYFANGNKRQEKNYKDDQIEGVFREWNQQGVLISEIEYSKGDNSGYRKVFYANGKLEVEEHYVNDELHGQSVYYDKNGKKFKIMNYHFGEILNEIKL